MVSSAHTSSRPDSQGIPQIVGNPGGFVIELEDGKKVYARGDSGLTAEMKLVVGDFHKPDIAILPATGSVVMEPEQAAYAANMTGCSYIIPFHDFPKAISEAADPEGYAEFLNEDPFGVLESYRKIDRFMDLVQNDYPHIKGIYLPIGDSVEL